MSQTEILDVDFCAADPLVMVKADALLPQHNHDSAAIDVRALKGLLVRIGHQKKSRRISHRVLQTLLVAGLQGVANYSRFLLVLQPFPILYVTLHVSVEDRN